MKYTSQHCFDKTIKDKMTLHREYCFRNCTKPWRIKFVGFRGCNRTPVAGPALSRLLPIEHGAKEGPGQRRLLAYVNLHFISKLLV